MSGSGPNASPSRRDRAAPELLLGLALLAFVVWYLACSLSLAREDAMDDAYITYVYGRNLAEGHGLRFNPTDAEPTAGASSLLHAAFTALAHARGLDPLVATRWLGLGSVAALAVILGWAAARAARAPLGAGLLVGAWSALGLALLPETLTHLASGMETLLFVALLGAYAAWMSDAIDLRRTPSIASQLLGAVLALALTTARPEGGPFAFAALVCLAWARARAAGGVRRAAAELAWAWCATALLLGSYFLWHRATFGDFLPNAYYVKTAHGIFGGGGLPGLAGSLRFAVLRLAPLALIVALLARAVGEREDWRARRWLVVPALLALAGMARVIREMAGGFRYEYAMLVPFVLLLAVGVLELRRRSPRAYAGVLLASGVCLPLLFTGAKPRLFDWLAHPRSPTERWRQGGPQENALTALGLDLARTGLGQRATILLSAAGQITYWSGMRAIDVIGLNDAELSGRQARTLDDVWRYIDAQKPDVIVSILPPAARDGEVTEADANFRSPEVQRFLDGFASELFARWDRERVAEMFRREMAYVRRHFEFGACYRLGDRWKSEWWIFVYVRRDSPQREPLLHALRGSARADRDSDLGAHFPVDPRTLRADS